MARSAASVCACALFGGAEKDAAERRALSSAVGDGNVRRHAARVSSYLAVRLALEEYIVEPAVARLHHLFARRDTRIKGVDRIERNDAVLGAVLDVDRQLEPMPLRCDVGDRFKHDGKRRSWHRRRVIGHQRIATGLLGDALAAAEF